MIQHSDLIARTSLAVARRIPPTVSAVDLYCATVTAISAFSTRQALRAVLRSCVIGGADMTPESFPWHQLTPAEVMMIRGQIQARYPASATASRYYHAVKAVIRASWRAGMMPSEYWTRICDIPGIPVDPSTAGRHVESEDLALLIGACRKGGVYRGLRDAAIIAILYGAGVRRHELVSLDLSDWHPMVPSLRVRRGKGGKSRTVAIAGGAVPIVQDWLKVRGESPGALICFVRGREAHTDRRLHYNAIYMIVRRRAEIAGFKCSPHDLRRTMAGDMLDHGIDICLVQRNMGHTNPGTTSRYDRRDMRRLVDKAATMSLPKAAEASRTGEPFTPSKEARRKAGKFV